MNAVATLLVRAGLALVFLAFGVEKLTNPDQWVIYLTPALSHQIQCIGLSMPQFFALLGAVELSISIHLIVGWRLRVFASAAALEFGCVLLVVGMEHTGIRDLGLLVGSAIPLCLLSPDRWTLDALLAGGKGNPEKLRRLRLVAWGGSIASICLIAALGWPDGRSSNHHRSLASASPIIVAARSPLKSRAEPILPIPDLLDYDAPKAALGRKLFHDPRLSSDNTVSCAHCHDLSHAGVDGLRRPVGISGQEGDLNVPSVFNAVFNHRQFWDGRAEDLVAQVDGPVRNPIELGSGWTAVINKLNQDEAYRSAFRTSFESRRINSSTISEAIAEFEKTLITPGARFDQWLFGKDDALSKDELAGYRLFKSIGCVACHQGVNVGGNMYQTMGKFGDYFQDRGGGVSESDLGRYNVTGKESDRFKFKVPGLRNVELTAPYFHDGNAQSLEAAVSTMARYQLGRRLDAGEIGLLVQFLKTLTGKSPPHGSP